MNVPLKDRIDKARASRELTLEQLAAVADISLTTLNNIRAGRSRPARATLEALAGALDLPVAGLIGEASVEALARALVDLATVDDLDPLQAVRDAQQERNSPRGRASARTKSKPIRPNSDKANDQHPK